MAPATILKEASKDGLPGIVYRQNNSDKTVILYYPAIAANEDVIAEFLNLAKGINKHIVVIDWTCENPEAYFKGYRTSSEHHLIFLGNSAKDTKGDAYPNNLNFGPDVMVSGVFLLDKQFRSYPDEWVLFKSVGMIKAYDTNGIFYADACQEWSRFFVATEKISSIFERKLVCSNFSSWLISNYKKLPSVKTAQMSRNVSLFRDFLHYGQENTKAQLREKISSAQSEMLSHYTAIQRLEKTIAESTAVMRSFSRKVAGFNTDFSPEKLQEMFESFLKNKMYTDFKFHDNYLEAYTDEIWCDSSGKKYYVGKFNVVIELNGKIKIHNILDNKRADGEYDHPHICGGIPCLGNIKEVVPKMIYNGDFIGVLNLLHQFLITYNPQGPYIALEIGWGKPEDWCSKCDHPALACTCQTCSECGESEDSCTCSRCPRYGDLMENVDCCDCDYYKLDDEEDEDSDRHCSY